MSHQQQPATGIDGAPEQEPSAAFLTHCYRNAIDRLSHSFAEGHPLAIMIGEGRATSRFVIQSFLAKLDDQVVAVRIKEPCQDAVAFMREIILAVGFQPEDMKLADLESVFRMFLSFQKGHARRTVICVEETEKNDWWVLDKIRRLVELEREGQFGLTVLISGEPGLKALLYQRPLSAIAAEAPARMTLVPFTPAETEEFVRRRVETARKASVEQVIDYHSITLIHELSRGVPDAVSALLAESLSLADEMGRPGVTKELVKRAYEAQRAALAPEKIDPNATTVNIGALQPRGGRLIVKLSGEEVRELAVGQGHILIGRSKLCDIRIDSAAVSRQHALIVYSPEGATLVDLSSTNGTYVDGYPIQQHDLVAGETITVGDCKIEYVLDKPAEAGAGRRSRQTADADLLPKSH